MGEEKGSSLVHLLVIVLSLTAFGFSIAAVHRGYSGTLHRDVSSNSTYCVYSSNVATGYGVGAFLFLFTSESLVMGVTKFMCFGRPLFPGSNRAWTIIYFCLSWASFLITETLLIVGSKKSGFHTKHQGMVHARNFSCETLRKGVFIFGAIWVILTMILNVYYYMYFSRATTSQPAPSKPNLPMSELRK
ncbi:unnamed protein product [Cuscuta epithymum]|uniref:Uncharacterized protein n=2 Tax=Cuscuta epithymum TaxID=186058 RepID=A0AAV0CSD2_9ASTE|nr:unnamed protein product [Cuscuta epithymum]CAH9147812.1 unnamed protein product [Cuscuta epithymum]